MKKLFFLFIITFAGIRATFAQSSSPYLVKEKLNAATSEATRKAPDAYLNAIAATADVDLNGASDSWGYEFYSRVKDSVIVVLYNAGAPFVLAEPPMNPNKSQMPDAHDWINSDAAMKTAQSNGGSAFLAKYSSDNSVVMEIGKGIDTTAKETTIWMVDYFSGKRPGPINFLTVSINAQTGAVLATHEGITPAMKKPQ